MASGGRVDGVEWSIGYGLPWAVYSGDEPSTGATRHGRSRMTWCASVLTLFPEMIHSPLAHSLAGRALRRLQICC